MTIHRWTISGIGCSATLRAGTGPTLIDTWTAALRAGRSALLNGELDDLAVSVDGELEALLAPGRDRSGAIDPTEVTSCLVEIHQCATAHLVAELIARPPT